ncbi:histidine utilization protein HutD [Xenophilus sp. AP218F]|nr:histidine utilization protein HutD [Xenophilus sp. AP218F]
MQRISAADFRRMPWANGGGVTLELLRWPHPSRPDTFALRLSVADVEHGGPFSQFPGVDRWLGLLDGVGMALRRETGQEAHLAEPGQTLAFCGEEGITCRLLGGAVRDFNLMLARDWAEGGLQRLVCPAGSALIEPAADLTLLYLQTGRWLLGEETLAEPCLLLLESEAASLLAQDDGVAWLCRVRRLQA